MPNISLNATQHDENLIVEQCVQNMLQNSCSGSEEDTEASTSNHYPTQVHQTPMTSEQPRIMRIEQLRIIRDKFENLSEKTRKQLCNHMKLERSRKLEEVEKLEEAAQLSKQALSNIRLERKRAENLMQQTLYHFRAVCDEIDLVAARSEEDIDDRTESLGSLLQDLNP